MTEQTNQTQNQNENQVQDRIQRIQELIVQIETKGFIVATFVHRGYMLLLAVKNMRYDAQICAESCINAIGTRLPESVRDDLRYYVESSCHKFCNLVIDKTLEQETNEIYDMIRNSSVWYKVSKDVDTYPLTGVIRAVLKIDSQ